MTVALPQRLTLEEFLTLAYIEESPAWEFVQGEAKTDARWKTQSDAIAVGGRHQ